MKIEEFYKEIKDISHQIDEYQEAISSLWESSTQMKKVIAFNDFHGVSGKSNREEVVELIKVTDSILHASAVNITFIDDVTKRMSRHEEIYQEEIDGLRAIANLSESTKETSVLMDRLLNTIK